MAVARIVIAGAGMIGRMHLRLAMRNPDCVVAAIADPSPAAAALAGEIKVPHFAALEEALDTVKPDGALIATPNQLHVDQALACIARHIPVLLEKPIAESVEEAMVLVDAAETAHVPLLIGHHRRHSSTLTQAKRILQSGRVGRITAVMASALLRKPDRYFEEGAWRKIKGGGPILLNLIHDIDNLRALCGEIVEVQAFASNAARGFAVEDTAAISLRFASGALGTYLLSDIAAAPRSWDQTAGENNSFAYYPDEECYLIAGSRGSLSVPGMRITEYPGTPGWEQAMSFRSEPAEKRDAHERQLAHFLDMIAGRAEPLVSGRDATRTLAVAMAIAKATETGLPVNC